MTLIKNNKEYPKFEVGDHGRISKYKNIIAKCYTLNFSEEVLMIKKVKNTVSWAYVTRDLEGEIVGEIVGTLYKK